MTVRADLREALVEVIIATTIVILVGTLCAELVRLVAVGVTAFGTAGIGTVGLDPLGQLFRFVADLIETVTLVVAIVYGISITRTVE